MSDKVLNVIVTYNRLNDLKVCIENVKGQTYKNLDILVVNNGSTDGTTEYLAAQTDIKVINQNNLGGAGGFYAGMKYMRCISWFSLRISSRELVRRLNAGLMPS